MSQHPDFFDKSIEEPDLEPLPEDIWAVSIKDPDGEMSTSPDAPHEWVFLRTIPYVGAILTKTSGPEPLSPLYRYRCRRCGLETVWCAWEDLKGDTDYLKESCTEILLRNTHEE